MTKPTPRTQQEARYREDPRRASRTTTRPARAGPGATCPKAASTWAPSTSGTCPSRSKKSHRPAGLQVLRPHRPAAQLRRDDRDRLRALRGRHPPDAHGRLARRRPHHGHPHHRPEPHRRPARRHARGHRRRADHPQADPRQPQGLRPDRGGGRPPDQLPLATSPAWPGPRSPSSSPRRASTAPTRTRSTTSSTAT